MSSNLRSRTKEDTVSTVLQRLHSLIQDLFLLDRNAYQLGDVLDRSEAELANTRLQFATYLVHSWADVFGGLLAGILDLFDLGRQNRIQLVCLFRSGTSDLRGSGASIGVTGRSHLINTKHNFFEHVVACIDRCSKVTQLHTKSTNAGLDQRSSRTINRLQAIFIDDCRSQSNKLFVAQTINVCNLQKFLVDVVHITKGIGHPALKHSFIGLQTLLVDFCEGHVHTVKDLERTLQIIKSKLLHHHAVTSSNGQKWDGRHASITWAKDRTRHTELIIQSRCNGFHTSRHIQLRTKQKVLLTRLNQRGQMLDVCIQAIQFSFG